LKAQRTDNVWKRVDPALEELARAVFGGDPQATRAMLLEFISES
jgi:hypothetical protein